MILIFSGHANASPQIKREVERAVNRAIPIIPFRIEEVIPSKSLEYFLSTPHWLDAFTPPLEKHLRQLASAIRALLNIGAANDPQAATLEAQRVQLAPPATPRRRLFSRWPFVAAAMVGVTLITLGIVAARLYLFAPVVRSIDAHSAPIDSMAFSPDGTRFASGSWDGTIKTWSLATGQRIGLIGGGHTGAAVPFSPDGGWIASGS